MDACRKYGNIRYHQVSTDEVYGDLLNLKDIYVVNFNFHCLRKE